MVSDDKKVRVIESIRKLLALGVPENEIIGNLTDVGINSAEARKLIDESRGLNNSTEKTDTTSAKKRFMILV